MVLDQFLDLDMQNMVFDLTCKSGSEDIESELTLDLTLDKLIFNEGSLFPNEMMQTDGSTRATCGRAIMSVTAPGSLDHVHVRFWADRTITQTANISPHALQQFSLVPFGGNSTTIDYFPWDAGTRTLQRFAQLGAENQTLFPVAPGTTELDLIWRFEDTGQSVINNISSPLSGQDFEASITDPWIEFSLLPEPVHRVVEDHERDGSRRFDRHIAIVDYNDTMMDPYRTNVRVMADESVIFSHIVAPDGTRITDTGVLPQDSEYSHNLPYVLLERNSQAGLVQITLPSSIARAHGPGEFQFVFVKTTFLDAEPSLLAINGAIAMIPLLFAVVAFRRVEQFRREAFGAYKRSARNLLVTLGLVVTYYIAVIAGAIVAGWFRLLSVLPLGTEALLLYLQVALAILAFLWLWFTAREMYAITKP